MNHYRISIISILLALCFAAAATAAPGIRMEGDRLIATTPALELAFDRERGLPVRLVNRLTGAVLLQSPKEIAPKACGLIGLDGKAWWIEQAATVQTRAAAKNAAITWKWADGAAMTLALSADGADLVLRLSGKSPAPGLVGCRWGLSGIVLHGRQAYLPETYTGMLVDAATPPGDLELGATGSWSHASNLAFVQDGKGVFGIWSTERIGCAVLFHGAVPRKGMLDLSFETHDEPPYSGKTAVTTAPWRLAAARGDWHGIADRYRKEVLLPLRPKGFHQPVWIHDIGACVYYYPAGGVDLETLAKQLDPARTLVVFPFYRKYGFDQGYPDWSPSESFPALHRRAKELGFRTCLWANGGAVDPRLPAYQALKQFQKLDPRTGKRLGWNWSDDPAKWQRTTCAQIHRGSSEYRRMMCEGIQAVTAQLHPDAWHIDYSIGIADGLGRVEGLTDFEGFYRLLKELRDVLPANVALKGEGLALGNAADMDFAEIFPYGAPARGLPVCAYLYRDVIPVAHVNVPLQRLGMAAGPGAVAEWLAWLERFGILPTTNVGSDNHAATVGMEALHRIARQFQRLRLRPDFSTPWSPDTLFRWRSATGVPYVCTRTATGARLGSATETLYQRLEGVNTAALAGGSLRGWPAQQGEKAFGLNPGVPYLAEPGVAASKLRIESLPQGAALTTFLETDEAALLRLEPSAQYRAVVDFVARAAEMQTGVLYEGTRRAPLQYGAAFERGEGTCGGVARRGFKGNPPFKPGAPGWGQEFGEFQVTLPNTGEPLAFESYVGLQDGAGDSDGVCFLLYADGKEIARQMVTERRWHLLRADVSAYRGKRVTFRLVCDAGAAHNGSWDLALWGEPAIRPVGAVETLRLHVPQRPLALFDAAGNSISAQTAADGALVASTAIPGTVALFYQEPESVAVPLDLSRRTHATGICDPSTYGCFTVSEYSKQLVIEGKPALAVQPRGQGRGMLLYALRLPAEGSLKLRFTPRLAGPAQTGQFSVLVNGETQWLKLVSQASPEGEQTIDLSAFRGKPILLSLCYATHRGYPWGGQAYWIAPRIE